MFCLLSYDIILDCSNQGIEKIKSKKYRFKNYITLNSLLLKNIDHYGLIGGTMNNIADLLKYNIPNKKDGSCVKWGFFIPSTTGLNALQKLVENEQVVFPLIIYKNYDRKYTTFIFFLIFAVKASY